MLKAVPRNWHTMGQHMPIGKRSISVGLRSHVFRKCFNKHPNKPCCLSTYSRNGFTYIGILIAITIIGVALAETGIIWHTAQQRDRERQLLYVGDQFRLAIDRYYNVGAAVGAAGQYPQSLDDLLRDPRLVGVSRYLRKIYYDPMTGTQHWGLIRNSVGRIMGVYSLSDKYPIKQSNFPSTDKGFEGKKKYSQWTFIYTPKSIHAKPGMKPIPGQGGKSMFSGQQ